MTTIGVGLSVTLSVLLLVAATALLRLRRHAAGLAGERERLELEVGRWRAADVARQRFLANFSHEIRAPMHGILGISDLLLADELSASQQRYMELVRSSAEALLALAEDLLDLSRIEADRLQLRPRDFDLAGLAGEVVRLFEPRAAERQTVLDLDLDPALPRRLHGDPVRLRQVLVNLVGNAVRFTRQGRVTLAVACETPPPPAATSIRFTVRDTGSGIRPEDQAHLFEPFVQGEASSITSASSGSGLGLVISKNLVELMQGEIGFESTRGVGTTFWFHLPLASARRADATPAVPLPLGDELRDARGRHRVLVVDDRASNREVTVALLAALGYETATADGGEEALALLAESRFDAVLLDCDMPDLDGYETCRRLRRREATEWDGAAPPGRRRVVVAVTAHAGDSARRRSLAAGMDDHLVKPFRLAELAAALDPRFGVAAGLADEVEEGDDLESRLAALERLAVGGGASAIALFLEQGEKDLVALRRALPRGDREAFATAAHALAGSSALLGADELAEAAYAAATAAHDRDLDACRAALPALEAAWRRTDDRLRA